MALSATQQSREFLIISDNETPGFICHNVESGESFYLDPPKVSNQSQLYGTPKLCQEGDRLYCVCGVSSVKGATFLFHRYKYSFSRNIWVPSPDTSGLTPEVDFVTNSPDELVDFLMPSDSYNLKLLVGVDNTSRAVQNITKIIQREG